MSCFPDAVICSPYGKALDLDVTWSDEDGNPVDLSGAVITIKDASPSALAGLAIVPVDLSTGAFRITSTIAQAEAMRMKRPAYPALHDNWFRIHVLFELDQNDVTQRIFVDVQ